MGGVSKRDRVLPPLVHKRLKMAQHSPKATINVFCLRNNFHYDGFSLRNPCMQFRFFRTTSTFGESVAIEKSGPTHLLVKARGFFPFRPSSSFWYLDQQRSVAPMSKRSFQEEPFFYQQGELKNRGPLLHRLKRKNLDHNEKANAEKEYFFPFRRPSNLETYEVYA